MSWARTAIFHEQLALTLNAGLSIAQAVQLAGETAGGELRGRGATWSAGCWRPVVSRPSMSPW